MCSAAHRHIHTAGRLLALPRNRPYTVGHAYPECRVTAQLHREIIHTAPEHMQRDVSTGVSLDGLVRDIVPERNARKARLNIHLA